MWSNQVNFVLQATIPFLLNIKTNYQTRHFQLTIIISIPAENFDWIKKLFVFFLNFLVRHSYILIKSWMNRFNAIKTHFFFVIFKSRFLKDLQVIKNKDWIFFDISYAKICQINFFEFIYFCFVLFFFLYWIKPNSNVDLKQFYS